MIKKGPHSTVYLRGDEKNMFKRLVYTPPDSSQDLLVEHKKSGLIFYFGLSLRKRNATCKLAATKDYRGACVF